MVEFCDRLAGLVVVSGPTGSGKSTTIAAMLDYINSTKHTHIVSIEDPIEYLHEHKQGIVNQREIGEDTVSFAEGVRHVLRQDPDVILIGEVRDLETVRTALTLAETGHLVFTTVHTNEAPQAVSRIVDIFPPYEQQGVRIQLSLCLLGVLVQRLVPRSGGHGRAMASEVLVATPAVRNLIRENNLQQLRTSIETGAQNGMHSLNDSLLMLERAGVIALETALNTTNDLKALMREIRRINPQWAAEFAQ
jgi:twitching motility protein PilT